MKSNVIILAGVVVLLSLGSGCVSVPRDAVFGDVERVVAERTGQRVHWNQGTAADREVEAFVRAALRKELTADDAVQVGLLNNQSLQATYEDLGIAQAELVEGGLLKNPTLTAEVRFPKYQALPFDIDVSQSFIDLLSLSLRKRAAGAMFEAAKLRVTNEVIATAAELMGAFYRAQGAVQLVEMRRSIVAATGASLDAAERLHDAGNITDLMLANERALHEQARIDLAKAERDALDAREELSARMGVWGADIAWTISPRLPEIPAAEMDMTHLESLAVTRRADLGAAEREVAVAAQRLGLTRSTALVGDLSVGGHVAKETDGALTAGPTVQVPLPVFNQGQPAVAAAEARFRQSQRRYTALAVQVRGEVRRARNKMTAARDLAEYYRRVMVPLRHQMVQQNQLQFNAMQIGIFELLQSKQAEIDAGREYVEALKEYWTARAELERAVGGRLDANVPATQGVPAKPESTTQPAGQEHHHHHGE
jgi:cobalt-zinc-cadmium efflux system outer membrane protein